MDFLKNKKIIDKCILDLVYCENIEDFYKIATKLYYRVNELVFCLENDNLKVEGEL